MELLLIGFAAGFTHVISGADHLAALAPFAARREQHAAWRLGLHWGLGHAGGVALIGLLGWLLKDTAAAEWLSSGAEQLVGVLLIAVGALGIRSLLRHRVHTHEHDHFGIRHSHIHAHLGQANSRASHKHSHAALGIGLLHGTAGGTHLWVVLPTLAIASFGGVALYLAAYALATVAAMTLFSAGLGRLARRLANGGPQLAHSFGLACCTTSMFIGGYWLFAG
ncbi:MAG: sulfite exporter TauE/SafE family protein [Verrucomicrobiota bacterium]|nr:sulfite exporter TauE/SafE family protein [Verrucomicrobiota bacterium]